MRFSTAYLIFHSSLALASPVAIHHELSTRQPEDPCKTAWDTIKVEAAKKPDAERVEIPAQTALKCLKALPLDANYALNTTAGLRKYLQFYSALDWLDDLLTPELEMHRHNINITLDQIDGDIRTKKITSNFDFEYSLFRLFGMAKDSHVDFSPTCFFKLFQFTSDSPLVSIAARPDELPKIYLADDSAAKTKPPTGPLKAGKQVVKINGMPAQDFLMSVTKDYPMGSWVDPDARYNELFARYTTPSGYDSGLFAQTSTFHSLANERPIILGMADGSTREVFWVAKYSGLEAQGLEWNDGTSLYNNICRVQPSDSEQEPSEEEETPKPRLTPRTALVPPGFYPQNTTFVQGESTQIWSHYFLDKDTGVLMLNSFDPSVNKTTNSTEAPEFELFSKFIESAIKKFKSAGANKVIVDLTGNGGGLVNTGQDLIKQFFPASRDKYYFGHNFRWSAGLELCWDEFQKAARTYGNNLTRLQEAASQSPHLTALTALDLPMQPIKPDGSKWSKPSDWFHPVHVAGGYFTEVTDQDEMEQLKQILLNRDPKVWSGPNPFKTEDVLVLADGMCGSTCSIVSEAFITVGAKYMAVGGRPRVGPMQGNGGIKGSQVLKFSELQAAVEAAVANRTQYGHHLLPDLEMRATGTVNWKNSFRRGNSRLPLELVYTPANHRLFYTQQMFEHIDVLHRTAAEIAWGRRQYKDMTGGKYTPQLGINGEKWVNKPYAPRV